VIRSDWYDSMQALVCREFGPVEGLQLREDWPEPVVGPDEVLIAVRAAGINFPDALLVQGAYQYRPPLPFVPGSECAGEVLATGSAVSGFSVGDRVLASAAHGLFATRVAVPADRVWLQPPGLDHAEAATIGAAYFTGYHALVQRGHLREGETLLVLGAGSGVGAAAVALGHALGARVIACASSPEKLALAQSLGAAALIDTASADHLRKAIAEATGGEGVDIVYDPVGGELTHRVVRDLKPGGRLLVVGFAAGEIPQLPLNLLLLKEAAAIGVHFGAFARRESLTAESNRRELWRLLQEGAIPPLPCQRFTLSQWRQAFDTLGERRTVGKLVLVPD